MTSPAVALPGSETAAAPGARRWCFILLGVIFALLACVEVSTRVFITRASKIEGRIAREYAGALEPARGERPVVLFVGNSLLDTDIDFERLAAAAKPRIEARRLVVEQTTWMDWHYGLRKLFSNGAKPSTVTLVMNWNHLTANAGRGEYSAWWLTSPSDVLSLASDMRLHPTNAASMVVANQSMFYALRSEIRNITLTRLIPSYPLLVRKIRVFPEPERWSPGSADTVRDRLSLLRELCERNGARLVWAPPPFPRHDEVLKAQAVAEAAGVPAIVVYGADDFQRSEYADTIHLNALGAKRFTSQLIDSVRQSPEQWSGRTPPVSH